MVPARAVSGRGGAGCSHEVPGTNRKQMKITRQEAGLSAPHGGENGTASLTDSSGLRLPCQSCPLLLQEPSPARPQGSNPPHLCSSILCGYPWPAGDELGSLPALLHASSLMHFLRQRRPKAVPPKASPFWVPKPVQGMVPPPPSLSLPVASGLLRIPQGPGGNAEPSETGSPPSTPPGARRL